MGQDRQPPQGRPGLQEFTSPLMLTEDTTSLCSLPPGVKTAPLPGRGLWITAFSSFEGLTSPLTLALFFRALVAQPPATRE